MDISCMVKTILNDLDKKGWTRTFGNEDLHYVLANSAVGYKIHYKYISHGYFSVAVNGIPLNNILSEQYKSLFYNKLSEIDEYFYQKICEQEKLNNLKKLSAVFPECK